MLNGFADFLFSEDGGFCRRYFSIRTFSFYFRRPCPTMPDRVHLSVNNGGEGGI